ncbi:MAG: germination protein YpeB [Clostridia bacterium]|nr:germination protein YpeB [Clostridia bacterium]
MVKSRRKTVRKASFLIAVIVFLAAWGTLSTVKYMKSERLLNATRERALTELGTHLDAISLNLNKCLYASTSPMIANVSTEVWRASTAAKTNLSEITDGEAELSEIYKFLSQVGEYTMTLNEKSAAGKKISKEETAMLLKLSEYSESLSSQINYLISEEQSGGLNFEQVKSTLSDDEESRKLNLGEELDDAGQTMTDYPTLIYDGPFSDNIDTKKSKLIEKQPKISKEEAQKKAADFLGIDETELYFLSECESNLSCYSFYNSDLTISVTKKGGLVSYMLESRFADEATISEKEAIEKAKLFLNTKGYKNVKETYYATIDGICTINFAFYENSVTYYTDLIKVSVALDNGEITGFDSTGYLMNHTRRSNDGKYKYTLETGAKLLNSNIKLKSAEKVFIPTDFGSEIYAYEYHCVASDGQEVLIYIDPETGAEVEILILLYSDNGVLTK